MTDETTAGPAHLVVRVWLPDRPGALGQVAARIGALGADIVGIDVLERREGRVVDEFAVTLPRADLVTLLVREVEEVDGASVEEWRFVDEYPDPRLDALASIETVCNASHRAELLSRLVAAVHQEFNADWAALVGAGSHDAVAAGRHLPSEAVLVSLAAAPAPDPDLAVVRLDEQSVTLLVRRAGHPFRGREQRQLGALARVADRIASLLPG